jgi:hypothetical protein
MDHCANAVQHRVLLIGYLGRLYGRHVRDFWKRCQMKNAVGQPPFSLSFIFRAALKCHPAAALLLAPVNKGDVEDLKPESSSLAVAVIRDIYRAD